MKVFFQPATNEFFYENRLRIIFPDGTSYWLPDMTTTEENIQQVIDKKRIPCWAKNPKPSSMTEAISRMNEYDKVFKKPTRFIKETK